MPGRQGGPLKDTYETQDSKEEERDSREDEQPAPAQAGHHEHGQDDLEHCPDGPEDLARENQGQRWSRAVHTVSDHRVIEDKSLSGGKGSGRS